MSVVASIDVGTVATVVAAVVAVAGVLGSVRSWYARTIGRRFDLYGRFHRLGVGANQTFFEEVIGAQPAIRRTVSCELPDLDASPTEVGLMYSEQQLTEAIWVDPLFYAQTLSDRDGTVLGFSVTTRVKRFAPRFSAPRPVPAWRWWASTLTRGRVALPVLARARLGRTHFADTVTDDWLPKVRSVLGAHFYEYSEAWSFGNPGHYSDYVCSANMASAASPRPEGLETTLDWPDQRSDSNEGYGPSDEEGNPSLAPWIESVRGRAVVDTWTVIKFPLSPERWPTNFGPNVHEVRTLP